MNKSVSHGFSMFFSFDLVSTFWSRGLILEKLVAGSKPAERVPVPSRLTSKKEPADTNLNNRYDSDSEGHNFHPL